MVVPISLSLQVDFCIIHGDGIADDRSGDIRTYSIGIGADVDRRRGGSEKGVDCVNVGVECHGSGGEFDWGVCSGVGWDSDMFCYG